MRTKDGAMMIQLWKWDNCVIAAYTRNEAIELLKECFPMCVRMGWCFKTLTRMKDCFTVGEPRMVTWSN